MQIAVIYSKLSRRMRATKYGETDEDSAVIANKVVESLQFLGHKARILEINEDHIDEIGGIRADCIFNLIEWCGQDIHLSEIAFGYLRKLKIPVTGSSEELFVLTGDKVRMKAELQKQKISTPYGISFETGDEPIPPNLPYPMIVKPSLEHCSIGLSHDSIAHNDSELQQIAKRQIVTFNQPALAEEFIEGREFLVYLIEEKDEVRVLPIEEVVFQGGNLRSFQTYEAKWETDNPDYQSTKVQLAMLSSEEQKIVESMCKTAFRKMGLSGYSRFDVRYKNNTPYILETNANPSVYDTDNEAQDINDEVIWGIKFPDYLDKIVESAVWHFEKGELV
ncbi:ATP-grasp domain-containing protein [Candidatus Woesebacteria bacterium]|nr:ATP-grasp domain-containing protein [Candidatus Woesebacteria bacterium]